MTTLESMGKKSSFILAVEFDEANDILKIEFISGFTGQYQCTRSEYLRMMDSESIGSYFHKYIKKGRIDG